MRRWLLLALALAAPGCIVSPRVPAGALTADQHNDLGVAYFELGDARRAAQEFERALALRPDWTRALVNLGDARLALGEVGGAIEVYRRATTIEPDDPGAANNLAWALLQDPVRWPEAEVVIHGALAHRPEPRGYYLDTLGAVLLKKGDSQGALDAFRAALADAGLADRGTRALILEHAAQAHARLGDQAAAARCRSLAALLREPGAGRELPLAPVGGHGTVC